MHKECERNTTSTFISIHHLTFAMGCDPSGSQTPLREPIARQNPCSTPFSADSASARFRKPSSDSKTASSLRACIKRSDSNSSVAEVGAAITTTTEYGYKLHKCPGHVCSHFTPGRSSCLDNSRCTVSSALCKYDTILSVLRACTLVLHASYAQIVSSMTFLAV